MVIVKVFLWVVEAWSNFGGVTCRRLVHSPLTFQPPLELSSGDDGSDVLFLVFVCGLLRLGSGLS
ncbi:hypothetical protein E1A91_D03G021200v1 [Gossypium mustelinum]|uniref:Uncharacterized protein n=2 Tax=Gossypium TaxID=3633 RepID=A0A5D2VHZ4_GOSMU|nr:hypothetical protein ES288_D03G022100v1 [Gossypium darwinii]TYI88979.1 hypothetical protein E1A91_D03G021200v1 [Gossypium mustelinum]